jgi:hypothetical protein
VITTLEICQYVVDSRKAITHTLLQLELLHALLVWGDGRALDADRVFLDSCRSIKRNLVIRLIAVGQTLYPLAHCTLLILTIPTGRTKS